VDDPLLLVSAAVRTAIKAILRPANDHYILPPQKRASVRFRVRQSGFGGRAGRGGAEGTRTPDIRLAKAALSQLSYGPKPWRRKGGPTWIRTRDLSLIRTAL
jgi:hypothetical protein